MPRSAILNVMSTAVLKAGKAILRDFGELDKLQVSRKSTANFATATDKRSEKILYKELAKARPDFGFLMEESGVIMGQDPNHRFVIDPIDGTHNFIHAVPYFCISVSLEKRSPEGEYEAIVGIIYDPIHNELFYAESYQGAFLNDKRIVVSARHEMDSFMLAGFMPHQKDEHAMKVYGELSRHQLSLRATGSTALDLAYVAAGRYDGGCFIGYKEWDVSAGKLLVREAGGKVFEKHKKNKKILFAANKEVATKIAVPVVDLL